MLLFEQLLNGIQFGATLYLVAAGLTLIFSIMNLINLSHGSLYMLGAYVSATIYIATGSFLVSALIAVGVVLVVGVLVELLVFRFLYEREPLDQVLITFGLIRLFNEAVRMVWGSGAINAPIPSILSGSVDILPGVHYPAFRLIIIVVGLLSGVLMHLMINHTRLGMLIRAGAWDRVMVGALGVNISILYTVVFGLGAGLAALAGVLMGPIFSVQPGMGDDILILSFVVIVIGGIGSIRGALLGAMLIGIVDTLGRAFLRPLLASAFGSIAADNAGPAIASMLIYITMAAVLLIRPQGLFPNRAR